MRRVFLLAVVSLIGFLWSCSLEKENPAQDPITSQQPRLHIGDFDEVASDSHTFATHVQGFAPMAAETPLLQSVPENEWILLDDMPPGSAGSWTRNRIGGAGPSDVRDAFWPDATDNYGNSVLVTISVAGCSCGNQHAFKNYSLPGNINLATAKVRFSLKVELINFNNLQYGQVGMYFLKAGAVVGFQSVLYGSTLSGGIPQSFKGNIEFPLSSLSQIPDEIRLFLNVKGCCGGGANLYFDNLMFYPGVPPIKILEPADGGQFDAGTPIIFKGSVGAGVTGYKWKSNLETTDFGVGSLETTRDDLAVGTHTITFSGQSPSGLTVSDVVQVGVKQGLNLRVVEVSFLPGLVINSSTGQTNQNEKVFSRPLNLFFTPPHWQATFNGDEGVETRNYPVSFARSRATAISLASSAFKIKGKLKNFSSTLSNLIVGCQAKFTNSLEPSVVISRNLATITTSISALQEAEVTMNCPDGMPEKVGVWDLKLTWFFKLNPQDAGTNQQTPIQANHRVFTTLNPTLYTMDFAPFVKYPSPLPPKPPKTIKVNGNRQIPTSYVDLLELSCSFFQSINLSDYDKSPSVRRTILEKLFDHYRTKKFVYSIYCSGIPRYMDPATGLPVIMRGLDALLDQPFILPDGSEGRLGACGEYQTFYHALCEIQGIDVKKRWYRSTEVDIFIDDTVVKIEDLLTYPVTNDFQILSFHSKTGAPIWRNISKVRGGDHIMTYVEEPAPPNHIIYSDSTWKPTASPAGYSLYFDIKGLPYETDLIKVYFEEPPKQDVAHFNTDAINWIVTIKFNGVTLSEE